MHIEFVEMNTIVTFLGMLAATVQGVTGYYAGYLKRRAALLRTNEALRPSACHLCAMATILYLLGLFAGINGFIGALTVNKPPLELQSASFNIHTRGSFPVLAVWTCKNGLTLTSASSMPSAKWLGIAMFVAWSYNWLTAAVSYYERTMPPTSSTLIPTFYSPTACWACNSRCPLCWAG